MSVYRHLAADLRGAGAAVLVTVATARGSCPRDAGATMLVLPDGAFRGSIGGGTLEWQALAEAQALLVSAASATFRRVRRLLGPDLGQCCGGQVELVLERLGAQDLGWVDGLDRAVAAGIDVIAGDPAPSGHWMRRVATAVEVEQLGPELMRKETPAGLLIERIAPPPTPVLLFGAGHVGRATALAFAPLPFRMRWIDPRPEAFPAHIPVNSKVISGDAPVLQLANAPQGAIVLVMTHSHALDFDIVDAALRSGRFAYVGLIGSKTKRARFLSRLREAGHDDAALDGLVCPVGLPGIVGKEPAVIAASVVAQALQVRSTAVARDASADASRLTEAR